MVSVIIPAFNRADKIVEAVQSVLNQTERDLEVLVIDDGSTDDTRQRLSALHDPRLRYVFQENAGACAARNRGIALARGDYIAFQDSDDLWRPRKLERQLKCLQATGADVVCCRMARSLPEGGAILYPAYLQEGFVNESDPLLGIGTQTIFARREVFLSHPFDEAMPRLQEFEWLCRVRAKYSIYYLNEILTDYRPGGDSVSADPEKLARACGLLLEKHPKLLNQSPLTGQMLAGRLRLDGEAAYRAGNPAYRLCLEQAAAFGGHREKALLWLEALHLYGLYMLLRVWAIEQRNRETLFWKTLSFPVHLLKRVRDTVREIRTAEPVRDFRKKRRAFGVALALRLALAQSTDLLTGYHTHLYHRVMRRFCDELFSDAARRIAALPEHLPDHNAPIPVWTLWWDGEEKAPPCVKLCLSSQRRFFPKPEYDHHVLTRETVSRYVQFPSYIQEKLQSGQITLTHFSDLLRAELLKKYGGLWADATVCFTGPLNRNDLIGKLYTNRKTTYPLNRRKFVPAGRWTGYLLQTPAGSPLAVFLSECFFLYWRQYDELIDYYFIDWVIDGAYRHIPAVREALDAVPVQNERIFDLFEMRNEAYSPGRVASLLKENHVHKLSHKFPYLETDDQGRMTVWKWMGEEAK